MAENDFGNIMAVKDLQECFPNDVKNNKLRREAFVEYESDNFIGSEDLVVDVIINGFEFGNISLSDGKKINAEMAHLEFHPQRLEYGFNSKTKIFTIKGSSPKMGNYIVHINF